MAASIFLKTLLVGCVLYLTSSFGDASLAKVSSLTGAVVQQNVAAHVHRSVFGHGKQANRFKRDTQSKTLEDPKDCIKACRDSESKQMMTSMAKNMARLVAIAMEDVKGDELDNPENEEAFKQQIEKKTIANMGPLFEDLCKIEKEKGVCLSKCPDSEARNILSIDVEGVQAAFCEPSRNWESFSAYWDALNCTNATESENPCESKCGPEQLVRNATNLEIDDLGEVDGEGGYDDEFNEFYGSKEKNETSSSGLITIRYETDAKKNTAAVGPVCKYITCKLDCYKPIMSKKCGSKAFDMHHRLSKLEPNGSLRILKVLNAIESNEDCKLYE